MKRMPPRCIDSASGTPPHWRPQEANSGRGGWALGSESSDVLLLGLDGASQRNLNTVSSGYAACLNNPAETHILATFVFPRTQHALSN